MDNRPAVNVRFYRPGDEEGMLRVLQASFSRWPEVETNVAPIDHLRWKLAAELPERNHIVAEANGEIVAARIGLTPRYRVRGGRVLPGRNDVDAAVLPEYRGRGVYSRIAAFGLEMETDARIVITSTGRPSLVDFDRELGHRPIKNRMISMVCDVTAQAAAEEIEGDWAVGTVQSFDDRIESFWAEAAAPFDFIAAPSMDNLNLRYCDARGGIGTVLQAEEDGDIVGFAALRVSRSKGHIAYLLALPDRLDVVRGLATAALSRLRDAGVSEVICALPRRHPYRSVLAEQGFTRKGHAIPLTCRRNAPDIDLSLLQEPKAAVHLMLGDTDLV